MVLKFGRGEFKTQGPSTPQIIAFAMICSGRDDRVGELIAGLKPLRHPKAKSKSLPHSFLCCARDFGTRLRRRVNASISPSYRAGSFTLDGWGLAHPFSCPRS